jgi:hypothetical protein
MAVKERIEMFSTRKARDNFGRRITGDLFHEGAI